LEWLLEEGSKAGEPAVKGAFLDLVLSVNKKTVEELMMKKKSTWDEISEKLGYKQELETRIEERLNARIEARIEERVEAEREQFRREIEQLRQENEQLRARLGA
jgi:hypothetical protein